MKCFIDGNCLCVVRDDFINLQESEAQFIELKPKTLQIIKLLLEYKLLEGLTKVGINDFITEIDRKTEGDENGL